MSICQKNDNLNSLYVESNQALKCIYHFYEKFTALCIMNNNFKKMCNIPSLLYMIDLILSVYNTNIE